MDAVDKARRALARRVRQPVAEINRITKALAKRDLTDVELVAIGGQIERLRQAHKVLRRGA